MIVLIVFFSECMACHVLYIYVIINLNISLCAVLSHFSSFSITKGNFFYITTKDTSCLSEDFLSDINKKYVII